MIIWTIDKGNITLIYQVETTTKRHMKNHKANVDQFLCVNRANFRTNTRIPKIHVKWGQDSDQDSIETTPLKKGLRVRI